MGLPIEDQITAEQFQAIGLVIAEWAAIERALLYILCDLTVPQAKKYSDYGLSLILATGMSYRVMLGLMRAIVQLRFPNDDKEFHKIIDDL
jgi:hypothetical protein